MKKYLKSITLLMLFLTFVITSSNAQFTFKVSKNSKSNVAESNKILEINPTEDPIIKHFLEEIKKHTIRIKNYEYGKHRSLFPVGSMKYVFYAISKKERNKWFESQSNILKSNERGKKALISALDSLKAAIAARLPKYFPHKNNFAFRNAREEKMMLAALKKKIPVKTLHMIGIRNRIWQIKTNSLGIPIEKYKEGFIWVQNGKDDHPYCRVYQVDLIRKYAGGGTYGSKFAFVVGSDLYAC